MQTFQEKTFTQFRDKGSNRIFSDIEFHRCIFDHCRISMTENPKLRTTVRRINLYQCEVKTCFVDGAIIEDVTVNGLKSGRDIFTSWGAVYKHVVLQGKFDSIMLSPYIFPGINNPRKQKPFFEANDAYYKQIDWALDISEGEFVECDIRRVPARLIRRDPETQVVVTREKALLGEWKKLNLSKTYWTVSIEGMLEDGDPDVVLVAPKRSLDFYNLFQGLKLLREAGVAEPD